MALEKRSPPQGLPWDHGSPLGGLAAAAAAALYLPLVILFFTPVHSTAPRGGLRTPSDLECPSAWRPHSPAALPLPSTPAGPERADCANEDWALPSCPPQGWAPHACLATSCANVAPPPLGAGCSFHLLVRRDHSCLVSRAPIHLVLCTPLGEVFCHI